MRFLFSTRQKCRVSWNFLTSRFLGLWRIAKPIEKFLKIFQFRFYTTLDDNWVSAIQSWIYSSKEKISFQSLSNNCTKVSLCFNCGKIFYFWIGRFTFSKVEGVSVYSLGRLNRSEHYLNRINVDMLFGHSSFSITPLGSICSL